MCVFILGNDSWIHTPTSTLLWPSLILISSAWPPGLMDCEFSTWPFTSVLAFSQFGWDHLTLGLSLLQPPLTCLDQTPKPCTNIHKRWRFSHFTRTLGTSPWIVLVFLNSKQRHRLYIFGQRLVLHYHWSWWAFSAWMIVWSTPLISREWCLAFQDIVNLRKDVAQKWWEPDPPPVWTEGWCLREVRSQDLGHMQVKPRFTAYLMQNLGQLTQSLQGYLLLIKK